jgi:hypothetical protein
VGSKLCSRIERLERAEELEAELKPPRIRLGPIKKLPRVYTGERHVAIAKRLPPRSPFGEWVEFEERPGPAPEQPDDARFIDICFVSTGGDDEGDHPAIVQS